MSRYRFALRPRWIVSHIFVLALVVTMIGLGLWQLDRLQQRKDRNARVRERTAEQPVAVGDLISTGDSTDVGDDLDFRPVTATGTYLVDQSVLVRSRSNDGAPGSWVLTPLRLSEGVAVVVNRGWIPNSGEIDAVPAGLPTPSGEVTVAGIVRPTETRGSFGPRDPAEGTLGSLARADVERLDAQVPEALLPVYVQLQQQSPALVTGEPSPVPLPTLDEGPHLSYAGQWFFFTTVALVGYPLILRRRAGEIEREQEPASPSGAQHEPETTGVA